MKLVISTTIFVFVLIFAIPTLLSLGIRYVPNSIQPSLGNTEKIYSDGVLSQEFVSLKDNLSGIGVSIKNPNFANKKNAYINIYDSENKPLRSVVLNGQNIADGKFIKILFEPINGSINKNYRWTISSAESSFNDALEIFLTGDKPSWILDFKVNENLQDQTLSFVTLHKVTSPFDLTRQIISEWIAKFFADKLFSTVYLTLLTILFSYFLYLNFSKRYR